MACWHKPAPKHWKMPNGRSVRTMAMVGRNMAVVRARAAQVAIQGATQATVVAHAAKARAPAVKGSLVVMGSPAGKGNLAVRGVAPAVVKVLKVRAKVRLAAKVGVRHVAPEVSRDGADGRNLPVGALEVQR